MKFELVPVNEAAGGILAHSQTRINRRFKKGYKLTDEDVDLLAHSDLVTVHIARFDEDDVDENEAAADVAFQLAGQHCDIRQAFTGRCNIFSEVRGLVKIDREQINALNFVDSDITVATIAPWTAVRPGQILATIKIIPFAVNAGSLAKFRRLSSAVPKPLEVLQFEPHRAGLITTRVSETAEKLIEKGYGSILARMERCGSTIDQHIICDHTEYDVSEAIKSMSRQSLSPIMILGAAAISDIRDVVPSALLMAGGKVDHVGMPVDPGNLIMVGSLNQQPVIGVPSCARSPKENGFDLVLHRILTHQGLEPRDIMSMGVGGLLNDTSMRSAARSGEQSGETLKKKSLKVGAVILGAGLSSRMGIENKLLQDLDGIPVIRRVVIEVRESEASPVIVVVGHQASEVRSALKNLDVSIIENKHFESGLSSSLKQGLKALPSDLDGFLVCLGDMPLVGRELINGMIEKYSDAGSSAICIPEYHGKRGNPVLWAMRYQDDILKLTGDVGAKSLLTQFQHHIVSVDVGDDSILADIDTPGMLTEIRQKIANKSS